MEEVLDRISAEIYQNSYVIIDNFVDEEFRKALLKEQIELLEKGMFRHAAVGKGGQKQVRTEIRSDEVLSSRVGLDNGADQVLRSGLVIRQQLLGILRQTITAITKRRVVVFPQPDGPSNAKNSPAGICRSRSSIAVKPGNSLRIPTNSKSAPRATNSVANGLCA